MPTTTTSNTDAIDEIADQEEQRDWERNYPAEPPAPHLDETIWELRQIATACESAMAVDAGRYRHVQKIIPTIVRFFVTILAPHLESGVSWPRQSWQFLYQLNKLAKRLDEHSDWFHDGARIPLIILSDVLPNAAYVSLDPPPLKPPRTIKIPTLQECREQGLSYSNMANLAGWYTGTGPMNQDVGRVSRAIAGMEPWPESYTLPPEDDGWPREQPSLEFVERVTDQLRSENAMAITGANKL